MESREKKKKKKEENGERVNERNGVEEVCWIEEEMERGERREERERVII